MNRKPTRKVISIGYFRELGGTPEERRQWPSITDHVSDSPQENEDRAVAYLRAAPTLGARSRVEFDVLDPSSRVPLGLATHTDGVYLWDSRLAYYVEKYHVRLPEDFHRHMESVNWQPPTEEYVHSYTYEI